MVHVSQRLQRQRVTKVIHRMPSGIHRLSLCLQMQVMEVRMQTMQTRLVNIRNGGLCTILALRNMVIHLSTSVLPAVRLTTDTLVRKTIMVMTAKSLSTSVCMNSSMYSRLQTLKMFISEWKRKEMAMVAVGITKALTFVVPSLPWLTQQVAPQQVLQPTARERCLYVEALIIRQPTLAAMPFLSL